jgi:hypothetical protein
MRPLLVVLTLILTPAAAAAQNITVHDIVDLSQAGLGEAALLALIEVNRPIFPVDPETLKGLKDAGVAPAVIVAMIKSGRTPPLPLPEPLVLPPPPAPAPAPQVVVVEHHGEPRVREVAVPVPVYVPVRVRSRDEIDHHSSSRARGVRPPVKPAEPVYWGWGGKLRPDAWKPTAADVQKDAKVPRGPQRK